MREVFHMVPWKCVIYRKKIFEKGGETLIAPWEETLEMHCKTTAVETLTTKEDALKTDPSKEFGKLLEFRGFRDLPSIGPSSYGGSYKIIVVDSLSVHLSISSVFFSGMGR